MKYYIISLLSMLCLIGYSQTTETPQHETLPDSRLFEIDQEMLCSDFPAATIKPLSQTNRTRANYTHSLKLHYTPNTAQKPNFLVVTTKLLYDSLANEIKTYAEDIHAIYGWGVYVEMVENANSAQLKALISGYQSNLHGVLFLGDLEECMFEIENDYNATPPAYRIWPCDLYFMDLDGVWADTDNNGVFDQHTGNTNPEIIFGRLSAKGLLSMGDEVTLIRKQLAKSHNFWWKSSFHTANTALNYLHKSWRYNFPSQQISPVLPSGYVDDIRSGVNPAYSKSDLLARLAQNKYGFTHLALHSTPTVCRLGESTTNIDSLIYVQNVKLIHSKNYAYNLFCCSACNWFGASSAGYLGGAFLFAGDKTMAVVGTTKTGGMLYQNLFYSQFPTHNIGEAFMNWWISHSQETDMQITNTHVSWSYGMVLLGDPAIDLRHDVSDVCEENLQLTYFPSNNQSNLIMYKAESSIHVSGSFVIPQGVHVIFDAPEVILDSSFNCPVGASFETRSEGCEL